MNFLHPIAALCIALSVSLPALAQRPLDDTLNDPTVLRGLAQIDATRDLSAQRLVRIGGIISPSGEELERAQAVAGLMREIGLQDVQITASPNAIGRIPGSSGKSIVFVATLDDLATVAEHQRAADSLPIIEGDRVVGPGTNTSLTTIAIAGGTLSIAISSERGGQRGFADEWADIEVMQRTAKNVFLTAVTQANAN